MLSIIIPTYNSAETLLESYESILESGVQNQEIIFVDDGSSDGTQQIISNIQAANPDVIFLRNDRNLGGGATRNKGVQKAGNPLVFILDSDDILVPGALKNAVDQLHSTGADGIATSGSIFFSSGISRPTKCIKYKSGTFHFEDLVSHTPNPVTINLLFTKQAFLDVGGYPIHHGFDTQGFGFRLLQSNKKILTGQDILYYQRLPLRPSYYIREARAGNVNRNWFYVFLECLYKFSPEVRKQILDFDYSDPSLLARGRHLFNVLADQSTESNFYCKESLSMDNESAYHVYSNSEDYTLSAWCFLHEIRNCEYDLAFARIYREDFPFNNFRLLYPLLAELFGSKMPPKFIEEFSYFFSRKKSFRWRATSIKQKICNRLNLSRHL